MEVSLLRSQRDIFIYFYLRQICEKNEGLFNQELRTKKYIFLNELITRLKEDARLPLLLALEPHCGSFRLRSVSNIRG